MPDSTKVAWVTGAGTGIGRAGALALAERNYHVIVSGRRVEPLQDTAAQIEAAGGTSTIEVLDVSDPDACAAVVARIVDRRGRLDVLVNSAGLNIKDRRTADISLKSWHSVIDINLSGVFHCMHPTLPIMRSQGGGVIINVSSWVGRWLAYLPGPAYNASKQAVNALTELTNMEEGGNGIRCTAICPGEVHTPIMDLRPSPPSSEQRAAMLQPEDLGELIAYIADLPPRVRINELVVSPTGQRPPTADDS